MSYFKPLSYWEQDAYFGKVDVVIIGGGIVGMNAALRLREVNKKLKITIIERSSIGTAASSRNAGFACYGSPSEIISDLATMSETEVYQLIQKRVAGLDLLLHTVGPKALRYRQCGGHEVFIDTDELEAHLDHLDTINRLVSRVDSDLKFYQSDEAQGLTKVAGVISNNWEGQIHPGHMVMALRAKCISEGINVLTNLEIKCIEHDVDYEIRGVGLSLVASKVIICNNAFAKELVDIETTASRNQVLLTSPIPDLAIDGNFHYDRGYVYFRNVGNRILIGGGRNISQEEESTNDFGDTHIIRDYLLEILDKHILPDQSYEIDHTWSGILGFNETKKPIIKEVEPGKFVAVGLGGMGVAIGTLVGRDVADLLLQS